MVKKTHSVVKNSVWLISESIITMVISLIIGIVSARFLGPNNYGLVNRFLPYISLANSICTFGLQSIIIKRIAQDSSEENIAAVVGSTMSFRLVLSFISIIVINIYALYIAKQEDMSLLVISVLQSISLIFNVYEILTYYFHARLQSKYIAISTVITSVVIGCWKVILLITKASVVWFAFSTTLQSLVQLIFNYRFFKKQFSHPLVYQGKLLKEMLGDSYHLLLASMGIAIYGQVDKIMIGNMAGNELLGIYSAAYAIATMWYFVPQAIANSLRSRIFEESDDESAFSNNVRVLFLIITILGICAGIGFGVIPQFLIGLLYGEQYLGGTRALMILGWVGVFANIGTVRSIWLVGKGLQRYSKYFTLMGALLNIILNYFLIQKYG
ncbi:MAG: flippase, partial [Phocaeicola sp.]